MKNLKYMKNLNDMTNLKHVTQMIPLSLFKNVVLKLVLVVIFGISNSLLALAQPTLAQPAPAQRPAAKTASPAAPFAGFGSNSKEPIKVDANKLEVFDKENRAVYSGDVVTVQGQTIMRCEKMTVYYAQGGQSPRSGSTAPAAAAANAGAGENSVKQIDCDGNVSILSGTQSATAKALRYEAAADTVTLTGNAVIADCENVQRGEKVVYDVKTGKATVDAGPTGRVQGIFTPGSDDKGEKKASKPGECPDVASPAAKPPQDRKTDNKGKTG